MPHDVDVKALMRLAIVYDIPMALNRATAEIILAKNRNGPTGVAKLAWIDKFGKFVNKANRPE